MDAREFQEWQAYFSLEPHGDERGDIQAAIIAATLANIHRSRSQQPFEVKDFLPRFGGPPVLHGVSGVRPPKPKQSVAQMKAVFRMVTSAAGGEIRPAARPGEQG